MDHKNSVLATNTYQIVMRPKYDVNELFAPLWLTSDDFLKIFRWPDENFMKFSSGHRIFFKKSSEVNQRGAMNPLTSYSGLITIWWVFVAKSSFLWDMQGKKKFFSFCNFFLQKEKIFPLRCELQRLISGIFSRFGYGGLSPCLGDSDPHIGAPSTCTQKAHEMQTSGIKIMIPAVFWLWFIIAKKQQKSSIFQKKKFREKVQAKFLKFFKSWQDPLSYPQGHT